MREYQDIVLNNEVERAERAERAERRSTMCDIGRVKRVIRNEAKPQTAFEVMIALPIRVKVKVKEVVHVRRIPRVEDKEDKR